MLLCGVPGHWGSVSDAISARRGEMSNRPIWGCPDHARTAITAQIHESQSDSFHDSA